MTDVAAPAQADAGASQPESPSLATGASSVEAPVKKIKTKIDGIEQEIDLDEITRDYQKYKSSDKRFQEAASMKKEAQQMKEQVDSLLGRAAKGDLGWLKGLVPNDVLTQWAESSLLEHLEWQQLPEAERRARTLEKELNEERDARKREVEERQHKERSALEQQAFESVEKDILEAINAKGYNVKVTPRLVRRMAEAMYAKIEASEDPQFKPDAKALSGSALKSMMDDAQEILSVLPREEILKLIPPKVRDLIRRADVDDAISQMPHRIRKQGEEVSRPRTKLKRMSTEDFFKKMDKKFN